MQLLPLLFLLTVWGAVLGLTAWSYWRLTRSPADEKLPPPGTSL